MIRKIVAPALLWQQNFEEISVREILSLTDIPNENISPNDIKALLAYGALVGNARLASTRFATPKRPLGK